MDSAKKAKGFLLKSYCHLQQILHELALPKTRDRTLNPIKGKEVLAEYVCWGTHSKEYMHVLNMHVCVFKKCHVSLDSVTD